MKRRGFLGFLGGAAVAGPKAAAEVGQSLMSPSLAQGMASYGNLVGYGASEGYPIEDVDNGSWHLTRIAQIKKMLTGVDEEDEATRFYAMANQRNMTAEKDIMALHSISTASKIRMFSAKQRKFQREQQRRSLMDELFDLEKRA